MSEDFIGKLLKDVPLDEQKETAGQFVASGYSADDLNLAFPGLLKQWRETTDGIKTIAKLIPTLTEKGVADRLDTNEQILLEGVAKNEKILLEAVAKIEALFKLKQKKAASTSPTTRTTVMLCAAGAIGSLAIGALMVAGLYRFVLIPQELRNQRNSDLIYLTTPKGKESLKSFAKCRKDSKPVCKFQ